MRDSYQYLSKSSYTPSTSLYTKTPNDYNTFQSTRYEQDTSPINESSLYKQRLRNNITKIKSQYEYPDQKAEQIPESFTYSNDGYINIRKLPDEYSSLRQTFDTRANNRVKNIINKYQIEPNQTHILNNKNKNKYYLNQYQFYSPKKINHDTYKNKFNDQKLQKYQNTLDTFQSDLQMTKKMSQEIKKLKQDRRKRLQGNKKQFQQYNLPSSYTTTSLNNTYTSNSFTNSTITNTYEDNQLQKNNYKHPKQKQNFKKKKVISDNNNLSSNTLKFQKNFSYNIKPNKDYSKTIPQYDLNPSKQSSDKLSTYLKYGNDKYYQSSNLYSINHSVISAYNSKGISNLKYKDKSNYKIIQINNFILGKSLGEGKFGVVYQALHKPTGWLFAIKKIPKNMIKSNLMVDQFILQLKLQTYLYHQNILGLYTHFDDSDSFYLVLQYMEDGTLFAHLKKNKTLPENQVAIKIKQIASAVKYLHQNQIAHRDIKPENIVLSHGVCKLCDFGWATICSERRKTYCGTFDYAPPQILQGIQYDYTADLWCLGVLTYQLLVGKAPFYHISRKQTMKKILNVQKTNIEYPSTISKTAINFMDSLIKKDPKQRLSGQMLIQHPFLKYADKNPPSKY